MRCPRGVEWGADFKSLKYIYIYISLIKSRLDCGSIWISIWISSKIEFYKTIGKRERGNNCFDWTGDDAVLDLGVYRSLVKL